MKGFYTIFISILISVLYSCQATKKPSIKDRIQSVPKQSGFKMDGYWVWGGSMIKAEGKYHLFASRWKKDGKFPENYRNDSEIVRAVSKDPLGPFQFEEIVIGERDSAFWDANMAHNPTIHKIGDEYVLYYIGSDFTTMRENSKYLLRRIGYASSKSINGPWVRSDQPIVNVESNNPAVLVEEDVIKLLYRDAPLRTYLAQADNYKGPYKIINDNVWPQHKIEDFYMFKMNGTYHFICEDNIGAISGHERWGVHLVSSTGIDQWKKFEPLVVYDHDLLLDDGSIVHCTRRERPQLFIQKGKITHLITGIYDGENSWCQPVEINPTFKLD